MICGSSAAVLASASKLVARQPASTARKTGRNHYTLTATHRTTPPPPPPLPPPQQLAHLFDEIRIRERTAFRTLISGTHGSEVGLVPSRCLASAAPALSSPPLMSRRKQSCPQHLTNKQEDSPFALLSADAKQQHQEQEARILCSTGESESLVLRCQR